MKVIKLKRIEIGNSEVIIRITFQKKIFRLFRKSKIVEFNRTVMSNNYNSMYDWFFTCNGRALFTFGEIDKLHKLVHIFYNSGEGELELNQ